MGHRIMPPTGWPTPRFKNRIPGAPFDIHAYFERGLLIPRGSYRRQAAPPPAVAPTRPADPRAGWGTRAAAAMGAVLALVGFRKGRRKV